MDRLDPRALRETLAAFFRAPARGDAGGRLARSRSAAGLNGQRFLSAARAVMLGRHTREHHTRSSGRYLGDDARGEFRTSEEVHRA